MVYNRWDKEKCSHWESSLHLQQAVLHTQLTSNACLTWQLSSRSFSSNSVRRRKYKTNKKTSRKPFLQQEHSKFITAVTKSKGYQTFNTGIYIYVLSIQNQTLIKSPCYYVFGVFFSKGVLSKDRWKWVCRNRDQRWLLPSTGLSLHTRDLRYSAMGETSSQASRV